MISDLALQSLVDRQAITELIYRYCRAVDRLDVPLGRSIWHDGSYADYGPEVYQGEGRGVIDLICRQHAQTRAHSHQVTNILIELDLDGDLAGDGDRAGSEAYCIAALRVGEPGALRQITVWTRYVDQWSRRGGTWGLDRRTAIRDFDEIRDVTPLADHQVGRRDQRDPSYAALPARPGSTPLNSRG